MQQHRVALVTAMVVLAGCADSVTEPLETATASQVQQGVVRAPAASAIRDQYIVVFRDDEQDVPGLTQALTRQAGSSARYVYTAAVKGFAAPMSEQAAEALARNPRVAYVEQDQVFTADVNQTGATWGLDRINQRNLPLDGLYSYTYTGSGVRVYIIDTGLDVGHAEFQGRAQNVYDALGGNGNDCNGHGTHVGGTVGGRLYGVAKQALIRGVRVLGCDGSGSTAGIIAAVDWVRVNAVAPAVANMSLGGGFSSTLNTAVNNLSNAGVFTAVAAGNSNANACNYSPASASAAYTTASSTSTDAKSSFSNFGSCVDGYAPGSSITSAWIGAGTTETRTINGTSMASPHVAGVAALIKHRYGNITSSSVTSYINSASTTGLITGNPTGTPNRLLHKFATTY